MSATPSSSIRPQQHPADYADIIDAGIELFLAQWTGTPRATARAAPDDA